MTDKIKKTEVLEKHIVGENEISYTLGEDVLPRSPAPGGNAL